MCYSRGFGVRIYDIKLYSGPYYSSAYTKCIQYTCYYGMPNKWNSAVDSKRVYFGQSSTLYSAAVYKLRGAPPERLVSRALSRRCVKRILEYLHSSLDSFRDKVYIILTYFQILFSETTIFNYQSIQWQLFRSHFIPFYYWYYIHFKSYCFFYTQI